MFGIQNIDPYRRLSHQPTSRVLQKVSGAANFRLSDFTIPISEQILT